MPTTNYTSTQGWNAPSDCRSITTCWGVGGGAAGQAGQPASPVGYGGNGGPGGGGGAAAYKNNIPTTPGEAFTIYVGGEGAYSGLYSGTRGWLVLAYSGSGQSGGTASVGDGLYNGSSGAAGAPGGGGAGDLAGAGGTGGSTNGFTSGGGGGGGAAGYNGAGGPGGNATNWGAGGGGGGGGYYLVAPNPGGPGGAAYGGITQITYTPAPAPVVSSCSPAQGTIVGGTAVTITGANFISIASVTFGGSAATSVVAVNSTTITCVTPAHARGAVNVVVNAIGGMTGTGTNVYTYVASAGFNMPMMGI